MPEREQDNSAAVVLGILFVLWVLLGAGGRIGGIFQGTPAIVQAGDFTVLGGGPGSGCT